eukprot:gene12409-13569_t
MTSVKICFENEVRRVLLRGEDGTSLTFHKLINTLYNLFPALAGKVFSLNWQDDEGDTVICSSDAELDDAIQVMQSKSKLLRFTVQLKGSDAAPVKPKLVHVNITCDECGVKPIVGIRYKCAIRNDFDLCEACEAKRIQPYPMIKIVEPSQAPQVLIYGLADGTRNDEGGAPHWPRGWGWRHRGPPPPFGPAGAPPSPHGPFPHPGGPHPHGHGPPGAHGPHGHGFGHGHHGGPKRHCHWGRRWVPADCVPENKPEVPVAENAEDVPAEVQLEEELIEKAIIESLAINDSKSSQEWKPHIEGSPNASVVATAPVSVPVEPKPVQVEPKPVPTSAPVPSVPVAPTVKLSMKSLKDVTYPDGTIVQPGTSFRKVWRVRNDGSQAWPVGVSLVFVGGDSMGNSHIKENLPAILPNEEIDVAVSLIAPTGPGMYTAYYRLQSKEQQFFGNRLWATIVVSDQDPDWHVVAQKPDSPAPTPAPSVVPSLATPDATEIKSEESTVIEETTLADSIRLDRIEPPTAPMNLPSVVQPPVPEPVAPNRAALLLWRRELEILAEMGFTDTDMVIPLLQKHLGSPLSLSGDKNARPNAEGMQQVIAGLLSFMN